MTVYLFRHGADDSSKRGGWSNHPLTEEGVLQSEALAHKFIQNQCDAKIVCSSDLLRAKQTAEILAHQMHLEIEYTPDFREVNNGDLAGMDNDTANKLYPGFYWRTLEWEQRYPNGESPKDFYNRIKAAWEKLIKIDYESIILVTHGGVINVILHLVNGTEYSNKTNPYRIAVADYKTIDTRKK